MPNPITDFHELVGRTVERVVTERLTTDGHDGVVGIVFTDGSYVGIYGDSEYDDGVDGVVGIDNDFDVASRHILGLITLEEKERLIAEISAARIKNALEAKRQDLERARRMIARLEQELGETS
jgi:hypothetical protein